MLQLWEAIKELKANQWQLLSVPSYSHSPDFEAHLAAGQPLKLHELTVPCQPPGVAPGLPLPQVATPVCVASLPSFLPHRFDAKHMCGAGQSHDNSNSCRLQLNKTQ